MVAASALIAALWVAICAAAPEFIWRGLRIAEHHVTQTDALSALLVGLVLAFFVEPLMERLRGIRHPHTHRRGPAGALFTAALSLVFALASIVLHDAMLAFVAERQGAAQGGLAAAISLTVGWALVPFAVTLAWLAAPNRWLVVPLVIFAVVSPVLAGWLFGWPLRGIITTEIPTIAILVVGYRHTDRQVQAIAWVASLWLLLALIVDLVLSFTSFERFELYTMFGFWMDVRFYLGWIIGVMLAPSSQQLLARARQDSKNQV